MNLTQVIYADVLFILNTYITYILMLLTAMLCGVNIKRLRLTLTAFIGGLYSFIILIPHISDSLIAISRVPAALLFIFISFRNVSLRVFVRLFSAFFLVNFIFAGAMLALWYFVHPGNMYLSSFIIYFDIEPLTLIILTAVCYFIIKAVTCLIKIRQPKNTIFDMTLHINNKQTVMKAFFDTGNNLIDPFTGKQVIIVSRSALSFFFPEGTDIYAQAQSLGLNVRFLPFDSLGGSSLLHCFRAERVQIKGLSVNVTLKEPLIALTDKKIKGGAFSALLPSGIFDNITSETGEDYDEIKRFDFADKK